MRVVFGSPGVVESLTGQRIRELQPDWDLVGVSGDDWASALRDADVAVPMAAPLGDEQLEGSSVRFVQQPGRGYDSVDLDACRRRGIPVCNVPSTVTPNAVSVAELAIAMTLDLLRGVDALRAAARGGDEPAPARTVAGRTVLLAGLGGIGMAVAARLAAFDVRLTAVRAHPEHGGPDGVEVHGPDDLDELLGECDVVIVSVPPSGDGPLFTAARFAALKRGAVFVNVARGSLVDEDALLAALEDGTVAGAGLDVFVTEPPDPDGPLVNHPRIIATPHVGGSTIENLLGAAEVVVANIARFAAGEDPEHVVT